MADSNFKMYFLIRKSLCSDFHGYFSLRFYLITPLDWSHLTGDKSLPELMLRLSLMMHTYATMPQWVNDKSGLRALHCHPVMSRDPPRSLITSPHLGPYIHPMRHKITTLPLYIYTPPPSHTHWLLQNDHLVLRNGTISMFVCPCMWRHLFAGLCNQLGAGQRLAWQHFPLSKQAGMPSQAWPRPRSVLHNGCLIG